MRINNKLLVKSLIYALIFIFLTVLETGILSGLKTKPNLIISLITAAAIVENERYAAIFGMTCGFLIDSSVGTPFLFSGIYYLFAAYITAILSKSHFTKSLFAMIVIILPVCLVREIFNMFYLIGAWKDFNMTKAIFAYIFPEYIYTVACAPLIFLLVKFTAGRISYSNL